MNFLREVVNKLNIDPSIHSVDMAQATIQNLCHLLVFMGLLDCTQAWMSKIDTCSSIQKSEDNECAVFDMYIDGICFHWHMGLANDERVNWDTLSHRGRTYLN